MRVCKQFIFAFSLLLCVITPLAGADFTSPEKPDASTALLSSMREHYPGHIQDILLLDPDLLYQDRWYEPSWYRYKRITYLYNTAGQLTQETGDIYISGTWLNDWRYTLSYDAQGRLYEWIYESGALSDWLPQRREVYTYDATGRLSEKLTYEANGDNWQYSQHFLYLL